MKYSYFFIPHSSLNTMAAIKCPHCGKYISSNLSTCTECGKPIDQVESQLAVQEKHSFLKNAFHFTPRRIVVFCFLAPFIVAAIYLFVDDICRANALEERAYARLENNTNLLFYEDFLTRFPKSQYADEVRNRYNQMKQEQAVYFAEAATGGRAELIAFINAHPESPYCRICEMRVDSLDWFEACEANTLDAYQQYLSIHPEGIFLGDATEARNQQLRLIVTPEETSILRGAVENFLSAMTSRDAARLDELTRGPITFCGVEESSGQQVVDYYQQNIHKDDVLGVHFQLEGTSINKRSVAGSDAMSYNLYSNAAATINRSSLDSAMVVQYRVTASFSPERRITSVNVSPLVDAPAE